MNRGDKINVQEFAERVERLCDFLLDRVPTKDGSDDLRVVQDLKEEAADLQVVYNEAGQESLAGLKDFMSGIPQTREE